MENTDSRLKPIVLPGCSATGPRSMDLFTISLFRSWKKRPASIPGPWYWNTAIGRRIPAIPFDYDCQVRYILHPDSVLEVVTSVTNLDQTVIPIADGWHPYFRVGGKIDGWRLQFHSAAMVEFDEQLVPTGRLVQYDKFGTARPIGDTSLGQLFQSQTRPRQRGLRDPQSGDRADDLFFPRRELSLSADLYSSGPDQYCHREFERRAGLL